MGNSDDPNLKHLRNLWSPRKLRFHIICTKPKKIFLRIINQIYINMQRTTNNKYWWLFQPALPLVPPSSLEERYDHPAVPQRRTTYSIARYGIYPRYISSSQHLRVNTLSNHDDDNVTNNPKKRARQMPNSDRCKLFRSRRKTYVEALEDQVKKLKRELQELRLNKETKS